ncbi:MAG: Response regulator PleD [Elusimicrobia bacterium ADurb.Bin231]|nr:MAG: Response regulator PleD [Elusimicrobia bacterium ADurb.Bin231]
MKIKSVLFLILFGLSVTVSLIFSFIFSRQSSTSKLDEIKKNASDVAYAAALFIDDEFHSILRSKEDMLRLEYKYLKNKLKNFIETYPNIKRIYTFAPTEVSTRWRYVIDAKESFDENGNGTIDPHEEIIPIGAPYDISARPELANALDMPVADDELKTDDSGNYISVYAPIKDAKKKTVGILRMDVASAVTRGVFAGGFSRVLLRIFLIIIASAIFSLAVSIFISSFVADPLARVIDITKAISLGNYETIRDRRRKDEVGQLINSINDMSKNIKEKIDKLKTLNRTAEVLAVTMDFQESLKVAMNLSLEIVGATKGLILLYNKMENILSVGTSSGMETVKVVGDELFIQMDKFSLKLESNLIDYISGRPDIYTLEDIENVPQLFQTKDWLLKTGATMFAPLMIKQDIKGFILLDANVDDKEFFKTLMNQISMSLENARLYREAIIDGLTGLYVYRYFEIQLTNEIRRAQRYGKKLAVLIVDIDHFKEFNDRHGHQTGNCVLKEMSMIMKQLTRSSDILARYGGEEIAIILPETDGSAAAAIAEKIRSKIEEYVFEFKRKNLKITVSVGVSEWSIENPVDTATLIAWADEALFQAKQEGRNRIAVFEI